MKKINKKSFEKIVNILLDICIFIFGLILLISIYKGIQVKILGNDYSSFFGYSIFEVQTGSMADEINAGDWIIVKAEKDVKINDVITFEQNDEYITHRVIEAYNGTYITKGDANNSKDDPISQEQIVGKVVKVLPLFGILRSTLFNPLVLTMLIITLYIFGLTFKKEDKKDEKEMRVIDKSLNKIFDKIKELYKNIKNAIDKKIKEAVDSRMEAKKASKIIEKDTALEKEEIKVEEIKQEQEEIVEEAEIKFEQVSAVKEEEISLEEIKLEPMSEEELDKTMYFRTIKVDNDEIDNTFLEIAKNQEKENEKERRELEKKQKAKKDVIKVPEVDDEEAKTNLEMLQNRNKKKYKNVIEKVMDIKANELNEIISLLNDGQKVLVNEATIRNEFIKAYIDVKYYNHCGDINVDYNGKNMTIKIVEALNEFSKNMVKKYKGNDSKYQDKVNKYTNIFILIMYLEQANGKFDDLKPIKDMYMKKIVKFSKDNNIDDDKVKKLVESIVKTQKIHQSMIKLVIKKLETDKFKLNYNRLTKNNNLYALSLEHNIAFSKVYSEYIVDKTYSEGIISEDKVMIEVSLLYGQLIEDMFDSNFDKKYIIYLPGSLYSKDNKLTKLMNMMDDEYIKNKLIILVEYEDLLSNKKTIKDLRKSGYRFALVFNENTELKVKDKTNINIADYIFINKKKVDEKNILSVIPEELVSKVIYEEIENKVEDFGGE